MKNRLNHMLATVASLALMITGTMSAAHGGMIDSSTLMQMQNRTTNMSQLHEFLSRDALVTQMAAMGVDPAKVHERLAQLTDEELMQMQARLNELPAGGQVLEVIGIVFVVILVLELLGITNIFRRV